MQNKVSSREELLAIFLEQKPSARSPYGLYGFPAMWKVFERADGLELFCRPQQIAVQISHEWTEVPGVSWQWQRNGKWLDQGRGATYEDFLAYVETLIQEPAVGHGTIAIFDNEARWRSSGELAEGTLVVVTETVPGQRHGTVREVFGTKHVLAEIDKLKPMPADLSPADYVKRQLQNERGDSAGTRKFQRVMSDYRKLVAEGTIPSIESLRVYHEEHPCPALTM
jgi:hypothetical protein